MYVLGYMTGVEPAALVLYTYVYYYYYYYYSMAQLPDIEPCLPDIYMS
jgi:hypothetical protein